MALSERPNVVVDGATQAVLLSTSHIDVDRLDKLLIKGPSYARPVLVPVQIIVV
jgi:hypothetical protein